MIHATKGPAANTFAEHMTMFCGHIAWRGYGVPEAEFRSKQDGCLSCLRSLAKRDRAFQKTARNWYGIVEPRFPKLHRLARARIAEEAIAREEGRAP